MQRKIRLTHLAAREASHSHPSCAYSLGAIVAKGNRILGTGANSTKPYPVSQSRLYPSKALQRKIFVRQTHAEVAAVISAIRRVGVDGVRGASVYVARIKRSGGYGIARPCAYCQSFLQNLGIRDIYWTTNNGDVIHERI